MQGRYGKNGHNWGHDALRTVNQVVLACWMLWAIVLVCGSGFQSPLGQGDSPGAPVEKVFNLVEAILQTLFLHRGAGKKAFFAWTPKVIQKSSKSVI